MQYGIVDIGSNTIVLIIYDSIDPIHVKQYYSDPVHLVQYNHDGVMAEEGIEKALGVLNRYHDILKNEQVETCFAFITEPWRRLKNTEYFLSRLAESGFQIDPLSGKEEAEYDFCGSRIDCSDVLNGNAADIGGGSTELISFKDGVIYEAVSIPAGCVRLKQQPIIPEVPQGYLKDAFPAHPKLTEVPSDTLIGIGGTCRAAGLLAQELFPDQPVTIDTVRQMLDGLLNEDLTVIAAMKKVITPGRWTVLAPGVNMLHEIMKAYHAEHLRISEGCVREGYLLKHIGR